MSTPIKPTILLVHGAWHTPWHYLPLQAALTAAGHPVVIPQLPTCTLTVPPPYNFDDDCAVIRQQATALAEAGTPFIVLMHSYGGVVGTASIPAHVTASQRAAQSLPGGALGLVYMAAFLPARNGSLASCFELVADAPAPAELAHDAAKGTIWLGRPEHYFYAADDPAAAAALAARLTWHRADAQLASPARAPPAYRLLPTVYLLCERDAGLPAAVQRAMVAQAAGPVVRAPPTDPAALEPGGAYGGSIDVVVSQAGHTPWLSRVGDILECVERAWKAGTAEDGGALGAPRSAL